MSSGTKRVVTIVCGLLFLLNGYFVANAQDVEICLPPQGTTDADRQSTTEVKEDTDYETVAEIKGGIAGIPGINEVDFGCTPPAFARGLWYLIATNDPDAVKNLTRNQKGNKLEAMHQGLQEAMGFIPEWTSQRKSRRIVSRVLLAQINNTPGLG